MCPHLKHCKKENDQDEKLWQGISHEVVFSI